jgi:thioredoxin reductase
MDNYDVIVCGGGTAGAIAAVAAARTGARTLVVENEGFLGGTASYGIPFLGFFSGDGTQVVGGLGQELVDRMISAGGSTGHMRGGKME